MDPGASITKNEPDWITYWLYHQQHLAILLLPGKVIEINLARPVDGNRTPALRRATLEIGRETKKTKNPSSLFSVANSAPVSMQPATVSDTLDPSTRDCEPPKLQVATRQWSWYKSPADGFLHQHISHAKPLQLARGERGWRSRPALHLSLIVRNSMLHPLTLRYYRSHASPPRVALPPSMPPRPNLRIDGSDYFSVAQILKSTGISRQTLWRWRQEGTRAGRSPLPRQADPLHRGRARADPPVRQPGRADRQRPSLPTEPLQGARR